MASFAAAAVALLPILLMALAEIYGERASAVSVEEVDDAGIRGAAMALIAAPFLYLFAVPVCYFCGALLVYMGLVQLAKFLAGAVVVALLLGMTAALLVGTSSQDTLIATGILSLLSLAMVLPAAWCWWSLAKPLHNLSLHRTAMPPTELER